MRGTTTGKILVVDGKEAKGLRCLWTPTWLLGQHQPSAGVPASPDLSGPHHLVAGRNPALTHALLNHTIGEVEGGGRGVCWSE